jgi:hypothetical protein
MRRLGTLGGTLSLLRSVNTHRRAVGLSLLANGQDAQPIVWTPELGMRRLPMLGGSFGIARHLNEFGETAGVSSTPGGALRAVLWTPTAGPLLAQSPQEETEAATVPAREGAPILATALCARARGFGGWSRVGLPTSWECIGR